MSEVSEIETLRALDALKRETLERIEALCRRLNEVRVVWESPRDEQGKVLSHD
jgi:hypothetical protein